MTAEAGMQQGPIIEAQRTELSLLVQQGGFDEGFCRYNDLFAQVTGSSVARLMVGPESGEVPVLPWPLQQNEYIDGLLGNFYGEDPLAGRIRKVRQGIMVASGCQGEYLVAEEALRRPDWLSVQGMGHQLDSMIDPEPTTRIRVMPAELSRALPSPDLTILYLLGTDHPGHPFTYHVGMPEVGVHETSLSVVEKKWHELWDAATPEDGSQEIIRAALEDLGWKKSRKSGSHAGNCVELHQSGLDVRDSKNREVMTAGRTAVSSLVRFAKLAQGTSMSAAQIA